jgi:Haspin like kinase domain
MERPKNRAKVYGKKGAFSAKSGYVAALFDELPSSAPKPSSGFKTSPFRQPLDDVTNNLLNVRLSDNKESERTRRGKKGRATRVPHSTTKVSSSTKKLTTRVHRSTRATSASTAQDAAATKPKDERKWLLPFVTEFGRDGRNRLAIEPWADIFDSDCALEKIAESSFAEVYRITNEAGSSIMKLMALRPPEGPGSQRASAVPIMDILSEVMILDIMAEIPGFVVFKGVHLIEGKPPRLVQEAYDKYAETKTSYFPKPSSYLKTQLFVGIEMADAGLDIERFQITDISQVWDIFLGVVVALAKGESEAGFEVRETSIQRVEVC